MSVFVDASIWPYGRMTMCHMLSENLEELHNMADKIGISRRWFQNKKWPHYDICKSKRKHAVALGAIEIDRKTFLEIVNRLKKSNQ